MKKRVIAISIDIDLKKYPKNKIKDGRFLNAKSFINLDELGKFGHNGIVSPQGEKGEQTPIIGNTSVFWADNVENIKYADFNKKEQNVMNEFSDQESTNVEVEMDGDAPF